MKCTVLIYLMFMGLNSFSQSKDTAYFKPNKEVDVKKQITCVWGDSKYMILHTNKKIFTFKTGLEDGRYTAFYDKEHTDSAMTVTFENGKMNGVLKRWTYNDLDEANNFKLAEKAQYSNGLMDGYRVLYFYDPQGNKHENTTLFKRGLPVKTIKSEW